jgi:release factor glutamine methyltransferase
VKPLEALLKAQAALDRLGVNNPCGQAEWMLEMILGISRSDLYRDGERELAPEQLDTLREFLRRRKVGEPLQYILGTVDFHHVTLKADRRALIPRPETEGLVELALEFLQELPNPRFLDIGTGTGAIALAILHDHTGATGLACDSSGAALELARENAKYLGLESRITFILADLFAPDFTKVIADRFALVVSNPPYVSQALYQQLPEEIREWEPPQALESGPEGLDAIKHLAEIGGELIESEGRLIIEIGEAQGETASAAFGHLKWHTQVTKDLNGKPRYLSATRG